MANWTLPTLADLYADFLSMLRARDDDCATMFDVGTPTNIVTGAVKWSSSNNRFEKWNGATFDALTSSYAINVTTFNGQAASFYAPIASPTFTGTPAAPTAAADTNTTQLATTQFVLGQAGAANPLMDGSVAVGTSYRYSRQDHVHPIDTSRAPLASPALTGTPTAPTAAAGTNNTQIATTEYVDSKFVTRIPPAIADIIIGANANWTTSSLALFNGTGAKVALLRIKNALIGTVNTITQSSVYIATSGQSGIPSTVQFLVSDASHPAITGIQQYVTIVNDVTVALDSNQDFQYGLVATAGIKSVEIRVIGYWK